ncbi:hypothetical protein C0J52_24446 [Blattella germanica]|nr:hypothetical protein C0J52_24446 [Blattella germanica]
MPEESLHSAVAFRPQPKSREILCPAAAIMEADVHLLYLLLFLDRHDINWIRVVCIQCFQFKLRHDDEFESECMPLEKVGARILNVISTSGATGTCSCLREREARF